MSLDRLMVVALVEKLAAKFPDDALEERARRGSREGLRRSSCKVQTLVMTHQGPGVRLLLVKQPTATRPS